MTNKELYRKFCQSEPSLPIFMQDWWMDAVCAGKQWDVLLSLNANGQIQAAMPYLLRKRMGMRFIVMPQQTQIGGVWIQQELAQKPEENKKVCQELILQLKSLKLAYYHQHFPTQSPALVHFNDQKFNISERITYRIEDLRDLESVTEAFSKNKKRQLQKALPLLHADMNLEVEDFYRFHNKCLQKKGKQISYSREFLLVLDRKAARKGQRQIIAIRNANNDLLAAAYLVWDKRSMYYLIPCYNEDHKDSGASALLVLESIKLAHQKGLAFDFEGSMIRGVANHYKQFGSTATRYYNVEKYYKWWFRIATLLNRIRERKMR